MCQSTMYYGDKMRYSDTMHTTGVFTVRIIILYAHMHIYIATVCQSDSGHKNEHF